MISRFLFYFYFFQKIVFLMARFAPLQRGVSCNPIEAAPVPINDKNSKFCIFPKYYFQ